MVYGGLRLTARASAVARDTVARTWKAAKHDGRDLLQVLSSNATPSTIYSAGYGYDGYGRMGTVVRMPKAD